MEEGLEQGRSELSVADGRNHGIVELLDVVGEEVGQGRVLGMTPESFDRVQLGRVNRKLFQVESCSSALMQPGNGRAMNIEPIQDNDQRALVGAMQPSQVTHDVASPNVAVLHEEVRSDPPSSRREAQAADHAQPIVSV